MIVRNEGDLSRPIGWMVVNPHQRWNLLAQAEHWEHLAAVEMASHFEECNTSRSSDLAKIRATSNANDTR